MSGHCRSTLFALSFVLSLANIPTFAQTDHSAASFSAAIPATTYTLTITLAGTSTGTVTSSPSGITCQPACRASFAAGTKVKLTTSASAGGYFAGWSGGCKVASGCTVTMNSNLAATARFNVNQTVNVLNHIIFMAQENRGLDHYFGALRQYWRGNKFSEYFVRWPAAIQSDLGDFAALWSASYQPRVRSGVSPAR